MKKIDWDNVDEKSAGSGDGKFINDIPTGAYVCKVIKVTDDEDFVNRNGVNNPRIGISWTVELGEYKDVFNDDFNEERDYWRNTEWFYYDANPGMFKHFWRTLERNNSGYKFLDDKLDAMVGKLFPVCICHEYREWNDELKSNLRFAFLPDSTNDVINGNVNPPRYKGLDIKAKYDNAGTSDNTQTKPAYSDADIPF